MKPLFRHKIFLSILSALLFWLGWPPMFGAPLLFIALVPLFFIEDALSGDERRRPLLFRYTFLAFLTGNLLTTWWIWHASAFGMLMAILLNALLMSLPFLFYQQLKRVVNEAAGLFGFTCGWIAYEYFHLNWDLSWPWLTLGNGLAMFPKWIQWYEYTGVMGGTYWIVMGNILIFMLLRRLLYADRYHPGRQVQWLGIRVMLHLALPIALSYYLYTAFITRYTKSPATAEVVIVQPNVDPYNEKFSDLPVAEQLQRLIHLSDSMATPATAFFIWPETAIPDNIAEENLAAQPEVYLIRDFLTRHPQAVVLTGASTFKRYTQKETPTARPYSDGSCCYDVFNTALLIRRDPEVQVYHKSKLVPGVEQMPYPTLFSFLEPLAINLGGTMGSLGKQQERAVFRHPSGIATAPVICYESIYGEYVNGYIRNGAQFISIITNDGWWQNTPGYRQHAAYASLRAIETRRSIARSANTGISAFYDPLGTISQPTGWWVPAAIRARVSLNTGETFYVKHGDWVAKIAVTGTALSVLFLLTIYFRKRFTRGKV